MTPDVTSFSVTPLSLISTRYRHYMNTLYHNNYTCSFLSQVASRVKGSSDDFSQGATSLPHSVETTVISELVVLSTLLLASDAGTETYSDCLLTLVFYPIYSPSLLL